MNKTGKHYEAKSLILSIKLLLSYSLKKDADDMRTSSKAVC